jgi:hypothetical protein
MNVRLKHFLREFQEEVNDINSQFLALNMHVK